MNENDKQRKVIILSLFSLLLGSLIYIFGITISDAVIPIILNYIIAMLLYLSSYLAVYNNNKINQLSIYKYLIILSGFFIIFITLITIIDIL